MRAHDGARLVGRVKRSRLVQRTLYRPLDRQAVRPASDDVQTVRRALSSEVDALDRTFGFRLRESWGW